jgi:4-hydroxy-tetrahydrodipicolinate synthase
MTNLRNLRGIVPALATVMNKDGSIDEEGIRSVVRFNIEKGVHAFAVTIIAGEFYKLSDGERKRIYGIVIDETNGKVPVLAGTSHSGTEVTIELSRYAKDAGADGLVVMPPYFGKLEASLYVYEHFSRIAAAVDLPIMMQDAEDYSGVGFSTPLCAKLSKEFSNIFMAKVEGARALQKLVELRELTGDRMVLLGGQGAKVFLDELRLGAQGNIPSSSMPELLLEVFDRHRKGDGSGAARAFRKYRKWVDYLSLYPLHEMNLEKETLRLRGIIRSSHVRGPRQETTGEQTRDLKRILSDLRLL